MIDELVGGAVTRTYAYGLQRISENQKIGTTQTASFYGYDGHGNVRFLTGSAGTATDTYVYDGFGLPITTTGTTPNSFLYSGEQFDSTLGMYYLRARYYNPAIGRFESMDTDEGDTLDPSTLHKYVLTANNPINWLDPTGEAAIAEYAFLRRINRGLGLQAHHLIEQRFAPLFVAGYCTLAVALSPGEHQVITNLWRAVIPYGQGGTGQATVQSVLAAAEEVYWGFPELIGALKSCAAQAGY